MSKSSRKSIIINNNNNNNNNNNSINISISIITNNNSIINTNTNTNTNQYHNHIKRTIMFSIKLQSIFTRTDQFSEQVHRRPHRPQPHQQLNHRLCRAVVALSLRSNIPQAKLGVLLQHAQLHHDARRQRQNGNAVAN